MQTERCLHVCLIGDADSGISSFLRAFRESEGTSQPDAFIEGLVARVELDGEPCRVRFTDNAGSRHFESMRDTALATAHAVLFCFAMDAPESLEHVKERWVPHFWASGSEAPAFLVGLRTDLLEDACAEGVDELEAAEVAHRQGMLAFLKCSSLFPETVRSAADEALAAAKAYYGLQWQLQPDDEHAEPAATRHPVAEALVEAEEPAWVAHERLSLTDDPRGLDEETASKNLSTLGLTPTQQHAYLRLDLPDLGLTSLDAVRRYQHLQSVNVSKNQLRTLQPLGALRCLLHLNASHNLLIRTQSFTAPDALETVDMSYNMIGSLGEWGVHKYLRELNLRGNFIGRIGPGFRRNAELRTLDLSENHIPRLENLEGLGLRSLFLSQNRLTSLDGVGALGKLQVLDVKHNNITSIAALRAEDLPRLRKLFVSENRLTGIKEVEGLQKFSFLCDLVLTPNPVAQLPHFRAQVVHRLPRLRSLDAQVVAAEEKVKADIIYGADVEARREIFEQILPEETFVDRRLVTEEGIAELELQKFGQQGDAGPYGLLSEGEEAEATGTEQAEGAALSERFRQAKLQQRLEQARRGGRPASVADLAGFPAPFACVEVCDADVPAVLEAAAEGGVRQLLLGEAGLSAAGVREILACLRESPHLRHVDLTGCAAVGELGDELVNGFPYARGCSAETADCGLPQRSVERLRNKTGEAAEALRRADAERERTQALVERYLARQGALEDFAAENCSRAAPPPPPPLLCHPLKWREGVDGPAKAGYAAFRAANLRGLASGGMDGRSRSMVSKDHSTRALNGDEIYALSRQRDRMLREWGCILDIIELPGGEDEREHGSLGGDISGGRPLPEAYETAFAPVRENELLLAFMVWEGVEPSREAIGEVRRQREEWEAAWRQRQERCAALSLASAKLYDGTLAKSGICSGQLLAHFSYLCLGGNLTGNDKLQDYRKFGLKRASEVQRPRPRRGRDLHTAVLAGLVSIDVATGRGFGTGSVRLKLHSLFTEDLEVAIRRGTIFQHVDWQHRQNLMVSIDYVVSVPAQGNVVRDLSAYCMNLSCACSNGNPMSLTDFYFDDSKVLESQGLVWDHFERCFGNEF